MTFPRVFRPAVRPDSGYATGALSLLSIVIATVGLWRKKIRIYHQKNWNKTKSQRRRNYSGL